MANAILDAVWNNQPFHKLTGVDLLLLVYLADKADGHTRECWPSKTAIAQALQVSVKTVYRASRHLRGGGYLEILACNGDACAGHSHRKTPHYRVAHLAGERKPTPKPGRPKAKQAAKAPEPQKRGPGRPRKEAYSYGPSQAQAKPERKPESKEPKEPMLTSLAGVG